MKKIINCDLCGTPCTIEGDDKEGTHYYVPVKTDKDKRISKLEKELALYKKAYARACKKIRRATNLYYPQNCDTWEDKYLAEAIEEIRKQAEDTIDTKRHLCDTCKKDFATCNSNPKFGNGIGNDNIYECDAYEEFKDAD